MEELGFLRLIHRPVRELLDLSGWADDFSPIQLEQFSFYLTPYFAPTGITLLKEGGVGNFLCLICEGSVDIVKESTSGKVKKLQTFGPGKVLGEMAFFDHEPASVSMLVKKATSLLILTLECYEKLCQQHPRLAVFILTKILRSVSQRLRQTSGKLIDLI